MRKTAIVTAMKGFVHEKTTSRTIWMLALTTLMRNMVHHNSSSITLFSKTFRNVGSCLRDSLLWRRIQEMAFCRHEMSAEGGKLINIFVLDDCVDEPMGQILNSSLACCGTIPSRLD
jgi:hypothetical protein